MGSFWSLASLSSAFAQFLEVSQPLPRPALSADSGGCFVVVAAWFSGDLFVCQPLARGRFSAIGRYDSGVGSGCTYSIK